MWKVFVACLFLSNCYIENRQVTYLPNHIRQVTASYETVKALAKINDIDIPNNYIVDAVWTSQSNVVLRSHFPGENEQHLIIISMLIGKNRVAMADIRKL